MKNIYTLAAVLLLAISVQAQAPVYTYADVPANGDQVQSQAADTTGFAIGGNGPNQTWNYTIVPTGSITTATFSGPVYNDTDKNDRQYNYNSQLIVTDSSESVNVAAGGTINTPQTTITTSGLAQLLYKFPLTYGDTFSSKYTNVYFCSGMTFSLYTYYTMTGWADAYGTLILNGHVFTNILRYKYVFNSYGAFGNYTNVSYAWLMPGKLYPLLCYTIAYDTTYGNSTATPGLWFSTVALTNTNTINAPIRISSITPNPCTEQTTFTTDMTEAANTQMMVYDVIGRIVWSNDYAQLDKGIHTFTISTTDLPAGMYMVAANANNRRYTLGKFVKQ